MNEQTDGDCSLGVLLLYVLFMAATLAVVVMLATGKDGFSWLRFCLSLLSHGLIFGGGCTIVFVDYLRKWEKQ